MKELKNFRLWNLLCVINFGVSSPCFDYVSRQTQANDSKLLSIKIESKQFKSNFNPHFITTALGERNDVDHIFKLVISCLHSKGACERCKALAIEIYWRHWLVRSLWWCQGDNKWLFARILMALSDDNLVAYFGFLSGYLRLSINWEWIKNAISDTIASKFFFWFLFDTIFGL